MRQNKKLIIITGCAGAGKSTIGKALARKLNYAYIDKDTVANDFTDFILSCVGSSGGDRESNFYRNEISPLEYITSLKICADILSCGSGVVLAAPFISQIRNIEKWNELKSKAKIPEDMGVEFVWIRHDIDRERGNLIKRKSKRDEYKLSHWDEYAKSVENITPDPRYDAYICENDLTREPEIMADWIIDWLRAK